jgi:hypothetical protein
MVVVQRALRNEFLLLVAGDIGTLLAGSLGRQGGRIMTIRLRIKYSIAGLVLLVLGVGCGSGASAAAPLSGGARTPEDRATQMLFEAVQTNDFAGTEAAVSAGASVDARDRWNITPIELAIDRGYFRIAHFLVSVRNSRQQAIVERPGSEQSAAHDKKPPAAIPAAAPPSRRQPAPPAHPAAVSVPADAAWPADRPNPFDPAAPAFGARLPLVEPVRDVDSGTSARNSEPMLATDTPAGNGIGDIR